MGFLVLPLLALLPGAWIAFATREDALGPVPRFALSAAFSPLVVSAQFLALALLRLPAAMIPLAVLLANLPAGLLVFRRLREGPRPEREPGRRVLLPAALAWSVPVAWLLVSWFAIDNLRAFGWHNLMHVDIAHQLGRLPAAPEEPELAGLALHYSWFAHGYWLVLGRLSELPLTRIHPFLNLILLWAVFVLVQRTARGLGLHPAFAALAGVLCVFGDNVVRQVGELAGFVTADTSWVGEPRLTAPLSKFLYVDLMPAAFALFAAALPLWMWRAKLSARGLPLLLGSTLVGLGLLYPIALPAALTSVGALLLWELCFEQSGSDARRHTTVAILAALVAVLFAAAWWVGTSMSGSTAPARLLPLGEAWERAGHVLVALGPFLLLAVPAFRRGLRERLPLVLALLTTVVVLGAVYALFDVRRISYKFVSFARFPLALLVALGVERLVGARRARWSVSFAVLALVSAVSFPGIWTKARPLGLADAPAIVESSYSLSLAPGTPDAAWTRAVRENTPANTVLVAQGLSFHATSFTGRSLFFPCEDDSRHSAGYSLASRNNLVNMRGNPQAVFAERMLVVGKIFAVGRRKREREKDFVEVLRTLRALERPIAIRAPVGSLAFIRWLEQRETGRAVFEDVAGVVWLIPADHERGS